MEVWGETMKKVTMELEVYSVDELAPEVKKRVLEKYIDINVDDTWWAESIEDEFAETLAKAGIVSSTLEKGKRTRFIWDLYHRQASINTPRISDAVKLAEAAGLKKENVEAIRDERLYVGIREKHYGGGDERTIIDVEIADDSKISEVRRNLVELALNEFLNGLFKEFLHALNENYEYSISYEQIIETLNANDYFFFADGRNADLRHGKIVSEVVA